jgi:hypothetical protein
VSGNREPSWSLRAYSLSARGVTEFAGKVLAFLAGSRAWKDAKLQARVLDKHLDVDLLKNVQVLLVFAFSAGLVESVLKACRGQDGFKKTQGATLPFVTFLVLTLSRGLQGLPLSGQGFNSEKSYGQMHKALSSEDTVARFKELVELHDCGEADEGAEKQPEGADEMEYANE